MNKLAFQIISKVVSQPGIDRKALVSAVQGDLSVAHHEVILEMTELKSAGLLVESDQGLFPIDDKADFYKKMHPFSDEEIVALMIDHMNKPGGSPTTIFHLNQGLRLHLDDSDKDYYEALLKENDFVKTTFPSGPTLATFFVSDKGKINLHKFGGFLQYLEAQKPKPAPEDLVLKYIENGWNYPTESVFEECGIEAGQIRAILAILGNKIDRIDAVSSDLPISISISDEGLRYLHRGPQTNNSNISYTHNDHSTHTHGANSPVVAGNYTPGSKNVINSGDNANQTVHISVSKNDWPSLNKALVDHGVAEEDIAELKGIVESEKPESTTLGPGAVSWILKVSEKALKGVGKIATGVGSNLLATWIKNYYHIHN